MNYNAKRIKKINGLLGMKKKIVFRPCEYHLTHSALVRFNEDDLDLVNGKWCCRYCEDYLNKNMMVAA